MLQILIHEPDLGTKSSELYAILVLTISCYCVVGSQVSLSNREEPAPRSLNYTSGRVI